jgi:hypothetical protein
VPAAKKRREGPNRLALALNLRRQGRVDPSENKRIFADKPNDKGELSPHPQRAIQREHAASKNPPGGGFDERK